MLGGTDHEVGGAHAQLRQIPKLGGVHGVRNEYAGLHCFCKGCADRCDFITTFLPNLACAWGA